MFLLIEEVSQGSAELSGSMDDVKAAHNIGAERTVRTAATEARGCASCVQEGIQGKRSVRRFLDAHLYHILNTDTNKKTTQHQNATYFKEQSK